MPEDYLDNLGLRCPAGGDFYVCGNNATEFLGCCTSDPCADGSGHCPQNDLRAASFASDRWANIPKQSCDDNRKDNIWWTCAGVSPPFMGCCASNPCSDGCPRDHLIQATLSEDPVDRLAFLPEEASSSPSTTSPTSTPSSSPEPDESGPALGTGAIAGIAVGGVAALAIVGVLLWLYRRRARRNNQPEMPPSPGYPDYRHSHMSAATTAIPASYHNTPTSPDFPKQYAHYQSPPHTPGHPHSIYSQMSDADYLGPHHQRHLSQMSGMSGDTATGGGQPQLFPVSEIDGTETAAPRIELAADESTTQRTYKGT